MWKEIEVSYKFVCNKSRSSHQYGYLIATLHVTKAQEKNNKL